MATQEPTETAAEPLPTLDDRIGTATGWSIASGALGVIVSVLQMLGVIELGVPGWFNLVVAVSIIVLGWNLRRRSLALTLVLVGIYVALLVDTLVATGMVLQQFGIALATVLLLRYIILFNVAQAIAEVVKGLLEARTAARNRGPLDEPTPATTPAIGRASTAVPAPLTLGLHPTFFLFAGLTAFLTLGMGIYALTVPLEGMGAVIFFGGLLVAGLNLYGTVATYRFIPDQVKALREGLAVGDSDRAQGARERLIAAKRWGARALAVAVVEPGDRGAQAAFIQEGLGIIAEIGQLDRDAARAIKDRYLMRSSDDAIDPAARSLGSAAKMALEKSGYVS
jgi:hypothetical protein